MIIGRTLEKEKLIKAYESEYSQFVTVYGRRRVGKTFFVRETFDYAFTFEHAGKYFNDMPNEISAWVSKDGGEWNELKIAEDHYSSNFVFIEAGVWDLADYVGSKVKFGFKFNVFI